MIKPEQVPLSILPAYSKALGENGDPRHAIAAALNAWPGMEQDQLFHGFTDGTHYFQPRLILPLTENPDAEA